MSCEEGEMLPAAVAARPLDDDNLLSEIFLRLPPLPSSLPRASAVSKSWRFLASDPAFSRRFRLHHHRSPPLLGCFYKRHFKESSFEPTLEAPNRVPSRRLLLELDLTYFHLLGCRHGLVLLFDQWRLQFLVWDPVTGHQHRVAIPRRFKRLKTWISGAVLRPAAGDVHFEIVLAVADLVLGQGARALACVYSSETRVWGSPISTPIPSGDFLPTRVSLEPAVLVGHSLYWILCGTSLNILEFDLERKSLAVIGLPADISESDGGRLTVMRSEGGGLGLLFMSGFTGQLWKRNAGCDGVASWGMARTIELGKVLSLNSEDRLIIQGLAEDNNLVLLWTGRSLFLVQLESLQLKKLFDTNIWRHYHPFESVYATGV